MKYAVSFDFMGRRVTTEAYETIEEARHNATDLIDGGAKSLVIDVVLERKVSDE